MFLVCVGDISYWAQLINQKKVVLTLNHTFQKQTSLSQYQIVGPNGVQKLSVPLKKSTRKGPYVDVEISYDENWIDEHWKSLNSYYKKSPFFLYYNYKIEPVYHAKHTTLVQFNLALLNAVLKCLKVDIETVTDNDLAVSFVEQDKKLIPSYPQVFDVKMNFQPNMSILDLLFNLGPEAVDYLRGFD
jgi:hypothetical protein